MVLKIREKINQPIIIVSILFFVVSGVIELYFFLLSEFRHIPIMFLGLLSLTEAYFIVKMKNWSVRLVFPLFVIGVTFGVTTIYSYIRQQILPVSSILPLLLGLLIYLLILTTVTVYLLTKRRVFQ